MSESKSTLTIPQHIAIVMDGNGRWAERRNLPRLAGHKAGQKALQKVIEASLARGVQSLTVYAFSQENWARPAEEVGGLMSLLMEALVSQVKKMHENQICLRFIGDLSALDKKVLTAIEQAHNLTHNNNRMTVNVALNYGGKWDVLQAVKQTVDALGSEVSLRDLEEGIEAHLSTSDQPEPDLFIRTAGEMRISNFMLWQLAYTELYVTDLLWPEFDENALDKSIAWFNTRVRKFGKTQGQITNA